MPVEPANDLIKPRQMPRPVRAVAVTGGKGGIGKSSISINLALALIATGKRVMLMDADLGLANIDVMLGLDARFDISHVLSGERTLDDVLLEGPNGLKIVPASSGISAMASLGKAEQAGLIHAFGELREIPDIFIVDTAAGISESVCSFCAATQEVVVVLTEEPAAITDAYAQIKLLQRDFGLTDFHILTNMAPSHSAGREL
ncbi:MAG: P-loop NTPase, partial [Gammaproteobacteria bacterium]